MESLLLYWVLTLIVVIILTLISDVGTATLITSLLIVGVYLAQECSDIGRQEFVPQSHVSGFEAPPLLDSPTYNYDMTPDDNINRPVFPIEAMDPPQVGAILSDLPPDVLAHNEDMLNDVLSPPEFSADDKIFDASVVAGYKAKKSVDIRSHWNNNNWKKYYDYELGIHADTSREWWQDDDEELARKHVVI